MRDCLKRVQKHVGDYLPTPRNNRGIMMRYKIVNAAQTRQQDIFVILGLIIYFGVCVYFIFFKQIQPFIIPLQLKSNSSTQLQLILTF